MPQFPELFINLFFYLFNFITFFKILLYSLVKDSKQEVKDKVR